MNNPNPFVPKGSIMELQSQRRSRLKIVVSCVLGVSVLGLVVMLIQGCKRDQPTDAGLNPTDTSSNSVAMDSSNEPPVDMSSNSTAMAGSSNSVVIPPPVAPLVPPPVTETSGSEYVIVAGDTLGKIAKAHHVSLKDLEAANPGVDSKHLKLKQKIIIPASTAAADATATAGAVMADAGGETYTIKSGDTLDKIAHAHHTTAKAIEAANNLSTTKIIVGHKLKIPSAADAAPAAAPAATPAPVDTTSMSAPAAPMTPPAASPAPAK